MLGKKPLDLLPPCSFMCCLTHNFSESLILIVSLRKINSSNIRSHFPKLTPSIKKVQVAQTLNRVILRKVLVYTIEYIFTIEKLSYWFLYSSDNLTT